MARKSTPSFTLQVTVKHGDLRFARYPVAVGHYRDDSLVSAERYLDQRLQGRLASRLAAGIYPERVGVVDTVYGSPENLPPGALIIGLGETGEITREKVREGVTAVALRHALTASEVSAEPGAAGHSVGISSLLIGTFGGQSLTVEESVEAILQGVINANHRLRTLRHGSGYLGDRVRIDRLELVELYEDLAIQALRALHRLVDETPSIEMASPEGELSVAELRIVPRELVPVGGGKFQRPTDIYAQGWWRRIQITAVDQPVVPAPSLTMVDRLNPLPMSGPGFEAARRQMVKALVEEALSSDEQREWLIDYLLDQSRRHSAAGPVRPGGLEFLVLTDRARAEASLHESQRELVDRLIAEAVCSAEFNPALSTTLYELLLPNRLKAQAENVLLVLDRQAAAYPWELLGEETGEPGRPVTPLSVRVGMLRQFRTSIFRTNPPPAIARRAFVLGDTASGFDPLPGARAEAHAVAAQLEAEGYQTVRMIESDARSVIHELFAREYQILHLAAHGFFDPSELADPERCGVVLGDGIFLTARELNSLRTVPELVFLNCCHLGQIDQAPPGAGVFKAGELAASLAEQLMRIGVKAVVAAGWAVDDQAATTFATTLYRQLLAGRAFGEAVLEARQLTWQNHGSTNTWGAYHCYGSPTFRLAARPVDYAATTGNPDFFSRHEYLQGIRDIAARFDAGEPDQNRQLATRLRQIIKALPPELQTGEMLTAIGEAWGALDQKWEAIITLRAAINAADASASIRAIELCANLECRLAEELVSDGRAKRRLVTDGPPRLLEMARRRLELLFGLDSQSVERQGLHARLAKVEALLATSDPARIAALTAMAAGYRRAGDDLWTRSVWLAAEILLDRLGAPTKPASHLTRALTSLRHDAIQRRDLTPDPDFWEQVIVVDTELLTALYRGQLADRKDELVTRYREALEIRPTPLQLDSVRRQIRFLQLMLERSGAAVTETRVLAGIVKKLKR